MGGLCFLLITEPPLVEEQSQQGAKVKEGAEAADGGQRRRICCCCCGWCARNSSRGRGIKKGRAVQAKRRVEKLRQGACQCVIVVRIGPLCAAAASGAVQRRGLSEGASDVSWQLR
jgi:hypothetical protein